jgi:hypothetical protein
MVQHIGLQREDERGRTLAHFGEEGIPVEVVDLAPGDSTCVRFIDPYGNTVFNQLQLPVLIGELEQMVRSSASEEFRKRVTSVVSFVAESKGVHRYVRFIGD